MIVIAGCGIFTLVMAALHVLRPDLPALERGMSRYAGGGTLMHATIAFLALASAWVALANQLRTTPRARIPLNVAAVGLVGVAATPIGGPSPHAIVLLVHTIGGLLFYVGTARAMLAAPVAGNAKRPFLVVYFTALSLFALGGIGMPPISDAVGLLQRIVFATALLWALRCGRRSTTGTAGRTSTS
ncbi:MAG: DUF998 domain-containing protein [Acidobacteria bacterium]|nr:DUF998 domain-containing protein [Acidobacteriota bacterium]